MARSSRRDDKPSVFDLNARGYGRVFGPNTAGYVPGNATLNSGNNEGASGSGGSSGDPNDFVLTDNRPTKIFGTRDGHIADTPAKRTLLTDVANDPTTTLGTDKFGNTWSGKTLSDGTQVWV